MDSASSLLLSCSLRTHVAGGSSTPSRPLLCLFSLHSCPPRYQPGETIYFTGLALRSTGVCILPLSLSLSLFGHLSEHREISHVASLTKRRWMRGSMVQLRLDIKWILDRSRRTLITVDFSRPKARKNFDRCKPVDASGVRIESCGAQGLEESLIILSRLARV